MMVSAVQSLLFSLLLIAAQVASAAEPGCLYFDSGQLQYALEQTLTQQQCSDTYPISAWLPGGIEALTDAVNQVYVFDPAAFQEGFSGMLLLFATGLGIGLVVSIVRKTKGS